MKEYGKITTYSLGDAMLVQRRVRNGNVLRLTTIIDSTNVVLYKRPYVCRWGQLVLLEWHLEHLDNQLNNPEIAKELLSMLHTACKPAK